MSSDSESDYFKPFYLAGRLRCGRRRKQCACGRRYQKTERDVRRCPTCGKDRRCESAPQAGRTCCRMHGGATPRGIGLPQYKGKGYSADMPARLTGDYKRFLSDNELHSLTHELAALKTLAAESLRALGNGSSADSLQETRQSWDAVKAAMKGGDAAQLQAALAAHDKALAAAEDYRGAREEAVQMILDVGRVATLEHKRRRDEKYLLPVEQANLMIAALAHAVREEVAGALEREKARQILMKISHRWATTLRQDRPTQSPPSESEPEGRLAVVDVPVSPIPESE